MRQFCCICIFLCGFFTSKGQSEKDIDSLLAQKLFFEAAVELELLFFLEDDADLKNEYLFQKAMCYKSLSEYDQALFNLKRIRASSNDSLGRIITYEKALMNYLTRSYQNAQNELLKLKMIPAGKNHEKVVALEAHNLIALNQWDQAKVVVEANAQLLGLEKSDIDYVFSGKLKPKNPDRAFNSSFFLPGMGQMYAGYFGKGLVSGGVQTVLVGASAYSLYKGYFFTGAMTGVALFYTFYFGGARHARDLAEAHNRKTANALSERLLEVNEKTR